MKKNSKKIFSILLKYIILLAVAFPNLLLFYIVFLPLTIYPSLFFLSLFYKVSFLSADKFIISGKFIIELIPACIASAAYYLLLILNLSLAQIKLRKRILMLLFSFFSFLVLNILRIIGLSILYVENYVYFDFVHKLIWYFGSTIFVIGLWFLELKLFRVYQVPFYKDLKFLYEQTKKPKVNKIRKSNLDKLKKMSRIDKK